MILERLRRESLVSEMLRSLKEVMLASSVVMDSSRLRQLKECVSDFSMERRGDYMVLVIGLLVVLKVITNITISGHSLVWTATFWRGNQSWDNLWIGGMMIQKVVQLTFEREIKFKLRSLPPF